MGGIVNLSYDDSHAMTSAEHITSRLNVGEIAVPKRYEWLIFYTYQYDSVSWPKGK